MAYAPAALRIHPRTTLAASQQPATVLPALLSAVMPVASLPEEAIDVTVPFGARRNPHMKTALVAAAVSVLALAAQSVGAAAYTFITIEPPSPLFTASAAGINNAGVIAGAWRALS